MTRLTIAITIAAFLSGCAGSNYELNLGCAMNGKESIQCGILEAERRFEERDPIADMLTIIVIESGLEALQAWTAGQGARR